MRKFLPLIILAMIVSAVPALAVDYWGGPPEGSWQRGEPGSTFQHFDFDQSEFFWGEPEVWDNPYGTPGFGAMCCGIWEWGEWEAPPELGGLVTGWHASGGEGPGIVVDIPNSHNSDPLSMKVIFLQITSSKAPSWISMSGEGPGEGYYVSGTWPTGRPHIEWPGPAPFDGQWYTYNYGLILQPNPEVEYIYIEMPFGCVVDQIVVDTLCTTDPAVDSDCHTWGEVKRLFR